MMNCEEVQKYLPELLDGSLGAERAQVEVHLTTCSSCSEEIARLVECRRLVSSLPAIEPPAGFATQVMAKVREAENPPDLWERLFVPFQIKIPLQAAAVVLIAVLAAYIYQKESLEHESRVAFQPESSVKKQKEIDNVAPSAAQAPNAAAKTAQIAEETKPRVEAFKDSAPERETEPLAKPGEQDKNIASSLQGKASTASEGGSRRLEQSSPSAEGQATGGTAPVPLKEEKNPSKDAAPAGKSLSSPEAPRRSVAPSLDSLRSGPGPGVAPMDHELAIRLKEPARDDEKAGDRVASGRAQAERRRSLTQEEAKNLEQAREQTLQTGQSQTVWVTIEPNQYELFKKELADLATIEIESSTPELKNDAITKSSGRIRIKVTILPPLASENPRTSQPSSR